MKISVIIPVYNTGKYLKRCLDSIINQNFKEIEIIIVNDCSSDNSLGIIKNYQKKDSRIILINKGKNEGLSAARNSGIKIAKGEYILHIDSDDWVEQNYFRDMYKYAQKEKADIVISDFYKEFENGKKDYKIDQGIIKKQNNEIAIKKIFLGGGYPSVWNKLIKKDLYIKNKIEHPINIALGEDLAVIPKLFYFSTKIVKLNKAYYHYFQNNLSITKKYNIDKIYEINKIIEINEKFFNNKGMKILIDNLKISQLTFWLFKIKYDFNDKKYIDILNEYLDLLKKVKIRQLRNMKLKIMAIIFKIFRNKNIFILIWNINSLKDRRNK